MKTNGKKSAAERTVSMFGANPKEPPPELVPVPEEEDEKAERVAIQDDANRNRDNAFKVQEWTTGAFGSPDATSNQYRMNRRGDVYYLEELKHRPGTPGAYGYTGVILHKKDLLAAATVILQAAKALKAEQAEESFP